MSSPALVPLPHATRVQVFNALFNYLITIPPPTGQKWNWKSQWWKPWYSTDVALQPSLILVRGPQTAKQEHVFGVTKNHWKASVWIYYRTDGFKTATLYPDQITDPFLDRLEQAFQTDPLNGRFTLNGLVWHCWIDGSVIWDPGAVDEQGVIVIPLSILL